MVGAYDWGGSVLLWLEEGHHLFPPRTALEDEFPPALQNHASYLGEQQGFAEAWEVGDASRFPVWGMRHCLFTSAFVHGPPAIPLGTLPRPVGSSHSDPVFSFHPRFLVHFQVTLFPPCF